MRPSSSVSVSVRWLLSFLLVVGLLGCGAEKKEARTGTASQVPAPAPAFPSSPARIFVDGDSADWSAQPPRHVDPAGDADALDLRRVWMAHDDDYLFFRLELGAALNLQEGNDVTLIVDADADSATGTSMNGLGAELVWRFGDREGVVSRNGTADTVRHAAVGMTSLPTVRSSTFEIAFDRSAAPDGMEGLLQGDSIRVALTAGRDRLPDAGALGYTLTPGAPADLDTPTLGRLTQDSFRLLSYNVQRDRFFDPEPRSAYARLFRLLQPDVIGFQEIYENDADATAGVVDEILDPGTDGTWHRVKQGLDLVTVSRYPILATHTIPGYDDYASGAVLLDATDVLGTPLLFVNMHPPCCNYADASPSRDEQRQITVDAVVAFLRDVQAGEGPFDVPNGTPVVVGGDMNFVGSAQQPESLVSGEIVHTERFGPSMDGSGLVDVNPRQTGAPLHTTWVDPRSSFPPGRLDYLFATPAAGRIVQTYVLRTPTLAPTALSAAGLEPDDTSVASDHLPLVMDLAR